MNPASQLSAPLRQASVSPITLVSDKPLAPPARLAYQFGLDAGWVCSTKKGMGAFVRMFSRGKQLHF